MKAITLEKKIKFLLCTKKGDLYVKYKDALRIIRTCEVFKPVRWIKNGHNFNLIGENKIYYTKEAFDLLKIDYEIGNNSPKDGKNGSFIKLTNKGIRQTSSYRNYIKKVKEDEIQRIKKQKEDYEKSLIEKATSYLIIEKIEGEKYKETASRLSLAIGKQIEREVFHKAVKLIRTNKAE